MSRTRGHLHFKQAPLLIEEQLLYISLNAGHAEGGRLLPTTEARGGVARGAPRFSSVLCVSSAARYIGEYMFVCFHFFNSYTYFSDLFLPPTINLISQPSSRSAPPSPSPGSVQAEMREGLQRKAEEELKQDARIKCTLTLFDCFCTIFLRVDLKRGWAASWISYSLLSVFIYNSTYLQITGGTSAPTLAPNLRSDVLQYTI